MTKKFKDLPVTDLRRVCDPSIFNFTNTSELPILTDMIGQDRGFVVQDRLRELAEKIQAFSRPSNHAEPDKEKEVSI